MSGLSKTVIILMLFVFGVLIFLPGIYKETGITSKDEYLLTLRTPMEMVARGEYATPYVDNTPRLKKPPLMYWLISANYNLFGINLLSARVWGLLFAIGLSALTLLIYRKLFDPDEDSGGVRQSVLPAIVPALLVLTAVGTSTQARLALLDLPLAFFVTLTVYFFLLWKGGEGERAWDTGIGGGAKGAVKGGPRRYLLYAAIAAGLSALIKGPVGPGVAGLVMLLHFFIFGGWGELRRRWVDLLLSIVFFFAVVAPWPVVMYIKWGGLFTSELFNELIYARFMTSYSTGPEVIIGGLMLLLLPWSFLYVRAFLAMLLHGLEPQYKRQLWLLAWTLAAMLPFLLLKVKFERYVIVAMPPAIMTLSAMPYKSTFWKGVAFRICALFYSALGLFFISFGYWFRLTNGAVLALLILFILLFFVFMWRAGSKGRTKSLIVAAFSVGLFNMALFGLLYPGLGIQRTPPELLYILEQKPKQVFYYKGDNPGMLSIRIKRSVQKVLTPGDLKSGSEKGIYLIVEEDKLTDLKYAAVLAGVSLNEPLLKFKSFYSRRSWVKFARKGATGEDWKRAYKERSLDGLKTRFSLYYISSKPADGRGSWEIL